MKTAISIPDSVFEQAEEVAKQLHISRSELYTKAVAAFLKSYQQENVTEQLNQVYSQQPSGLDPVLNQLQQLSSFTEAW